MLLHEKKEELRQEIQCENETDTNLLLRDILVELRLLTTLMANSMQDVKKHNKRSKEQIEKIKENLPPEAKAIYDNLMSGLS